MSAAHPQELHPAGGCVLKESKCLLFLALSSPECPGSCQLPLPAQILAEQGRAALLILGYLPPLQEFVFLPSSKLNQHRQGAYSCQNTQPALILRSVGSQIPLTNIWRQGQHPASLLCGLILYFPGFGKGFLTSPLYWMLYFNFIRKQMGAEPSLPWGISLWVLPRSASSAGTATERGGKNVCKSLRGLWVTQNLPWFNLFLEK